jgi:hypothetical protein
LAYRANVATLNQGRWPPVLLRHVDMKRGVFLTYRHSMQAKPGESHEVLAALRGPWPPRTLPRADEVTLVVSRVPPALTVTELEPQQMPSVVRRLQVMVAPDARPGDYPFFLIVQWQGQDVGTVPCTVTVAP